MITSFFQPKKRKAASSSLAGPAGAAGNQENESSKRTKVAESTSNAANKSSEENSAVRDLLMRLNPPDPSSPEKSWQDALQKHFSSIRFEALAKFVSKERKSATIFPPPEDVFSCLNWTPFDKVKVVIVGQDPYHGPNQGHGLCFSVRKGVQIPPSLRNIYKELSNDNGVNFPASGFMPTHGYLERWARQGVLLLNAVLTVRQGQANSHQKKGWEEVTDEILRALDRDRRQKKQGIVFLLFGKPAAAKTMSALSGSNPLQKIIATSHPSPLGATKTKAPFLGSKCFSRANDALIEFGYDPINWNVDG